MTAREQRVVVRDLRRRAAAALATYEELREQLYEHSPPQRRRRRRRTRAPDATNVLRALNADAIMSDEVYLSAMRLKYKLWTVIADTTLDSEIVIWYLDDICAPFLYECMFRLVRRIPTLQELAVCAWATVDPALPLITDAVPLVLRRRINLDARMEAARRFHAYNGRYVIGTAVQRFIDRSKGTKITMHPHLTCGHIHFILSYVITECMRLYGDGVCTECGSSLHIVK